MELEQVTIPPHTLAVTDATPGPADPEPCCHQFLSPWPAPSDLRGLTNDPMISKRVLMLACFSLFCFPRTDGITSQPPLPGRCEY